MLWSDPETADPLEVIDLLSDFPSAAGPDLVSPDTHDGTSVLAFTFLAMGANDPVEVTAWDCDETDDLYIWICERLERENIGLAALRIEGEFSYVRFSAAFHLPLEGSSLAGGYAASHYMKLLEYTDRHWKTGGIYAANPTLQRIISLEGLPLHLHGVESDSRHGGHIIQMRGKGLQVKVSPLKDLVMRIRNLDHTWLPVRNVSIDERNDE